MWQYKHVSIPCNFFTERANVLGSDGWELVAAWNVGSIVEEDKKTYIALDCVFKKNITPPPGQAKKKR